MPYTPRRNDTEKERKKEHGDKSERRKDEERSPRKDRSRKGNSRSAHRKSLSSPDVRPARSSSPPTRRKKRDFSLDDEQELSSMSPSTSRTSLPYPSFSKAHSKESVLPARVKLNDAITPDPTDLGEGNGDSDGGDTGGGADEETKAAQVTTDTPVMGTRNAEGKNGISGGPPPSPPLTAMSKPPKRSTTPRSRVGSRTSKGPKGSSSRPVTEEKMDLKRAASGPHSWISRFSSSSRKEKEGSSRASSATTNRHSSATSRRSPASPVSEQVERARSREQVKDRSSEVSGDTASTFDSDATSVARDHQARRMDTLNPASASTVTATYSEVASSDNEVTTRATTPPLEKAREAAEVRFQAEEADYKPVGTYSLQPPPPPPPPTLPITIPRVDYLLHNGGLPRQWTHFWKAPSRSHSVKRGMARRVYQSPQ